MERGSNMFISRLLLIPVERKEQQMFSRTYNMDLNIEKTKNLEILLNNNGTRKSNTPLTEELVAKHVPGVMNFNNLPIMTNIPNGWNTKRLRYIMVVESNTGVGPVRIEYIQGFTEYYDPSMRGSLDDRMLFYINSVTTLIKTLNPINNTFSYRPENSVNILSNLTPNEFNNTPNLSTVRPLDLVDDMYMLDNYSDDGVNYTSTTSAYNQGIKISNRVNSSGNRHFVKTLNGLITARDNTDMGNSQADVLIAAGSKVSEIYPTAISFISTINSLQGGFEPNSFTLQTLNSINPDINQRTHIFGEGKLVTTSHVNMLDTNDSESFTNTSMETSVAYSVVNYVNSIMIENLLSEFSFTATNAHSAMEPVVVPSGANSLIDDLDLALFTNKIIDKIKYTLYPDITQNNILILDIAVHTHILEDSTVSVSINGNPYVVFRFPTYADSLYNPVITTPESKNMLVNDFMTVFDSTYSY